MPKEYVITGNHVNTQQNSVAVIVGKHGYYVRPRGLHYNKILEGFTETVHRRLWHPRSWLNAAIF